MDIKGLINKLRGNEEPEEEYEAKPVIDRHLDSLRRERQTQANEVEKIELKKAIAEYKKDRMRKNLYGIGKEKEKDEYLGKVQSKKVEIMNKKRDILKQQSMMKQKSILGQKSMLNNRKEEFKKKKVRNILF